MTLFSRTESKILCLTEAVNKSSLGKAMAITVSWTVTNITIDTMRYFVYMRDPEVTDVYPLISLLS